MLRPPPTQAIPSERCMEGSTSRFMLSGVGTSLQEEEEDGDAEQGDDAHVAHGLAGHDGGCHQLNQQIASDSLGCAQQMQKEAEQIDLQAFVDSPLSSSGLFNFPAKIEPALDSQLLLAEYIHRVQQNVEYPRTFETLLMREEPRYENLPQSLNCHRSSCQYNANYQNNRDQFEGREAGGNGRISQFTCNCIADRKRQVGRESCGESSGSHPSLSVPTSPPPVSLPASPERSSLPSTEMATQPTLNSARMDMLSSAENASFACPICIPETFAETMIRFGPIFVTDLQREAYRKNRQMDVDYTRVWLGTTTEEVVRLACMFGCRRRPSAWRAEVERHEHRAMCASVGQECADEVIVRGQWKMRVDRFVKLHANGSSTRSARRDKTRACQPRIRMESDDGGRRTQARIVMGITQSIAVLYSILADCADRFASPPSVLEAVESALHALERWKTAREALPFLRSDHDHSLRDVTAQLETECTMLRRVVATLRDEQLVRRLSSLQPAHAIRTQVAALRGAAWPRASYGGSPLRASAGRVGAPPTSNTVFDDNAARREGVSAGLHFAENHVPLSVGGLGRLHRGNIMSHDDDCMSMFSGSTGVSTSATSVATNSTLRSWESAKSNASAGSIGSIGSVFSALSTTGNTVIANERGSTRSREECYTHSPEPRRKRPSTM